MSKASYFDLYNDPREVQPKMLPMFPTKGMFDVMKARHELWMEQFPNNEEAFGFPFTGIENARPKTLEHAKPRFSPDQVPFDAEAAPRRAHQNSEYME